MPSVTLRALGTALLLSSTAALAACGSTPCEDASEEIRVLVGRCGVVRGDWSDAMDAICTDTMRTQDECLLACFRAGSCDEYGGVAGIEGSNAFTTCTAQCMNPFTPPGPIAATCPGWEKPAFSADFGTREEDTPVAIAVDGTGNVGAVVTPSPAGPLDFGDGPITTPASGSCHVRLDPSGALLWGACFEDETYAMAMSPGGDEVLAGGGDTAVLTRYDAAGKQVWRQSFSADYHAVFESVAIAADGAIVAGGRFVGDADLGNGVVLPSFDQFDVSCVVRLDAGGQPLWGRRFGEAKWFRVAADGAGNVFVTGVSTGPLGFGGATVPADSLFAAKFDPDGKVLWARGFGAVVAPLDHGSAVDPATGHLVLTGTLCDKPLFFSSPSMVAPLGHCAAYAAELDADGLEVWSRIFVGGRFPSVAVSPAGGLFVTGIGDYDGVDFGTGKFFSRQGSWFVAKLAADGSFVCGRQIPPSGLTHTQVTADPAGGVVVMGRNTGLADLGNGQLTTVGYEDLLLARLPP